MLIYGNSGDVVQVIPLFREPHDIPSTSTWQYFLAYKALLPVSDSMRLGHLTWHHGCYDRAGYSSMARIMEQFHTL